MKEKLLTLEKFDRAKAWIEAALQDLQRTLSQHDVHVYRELTGTAAVTATPYTHAKWDVVDESVTEYRDGMIVCVKVPAAGNGTYGTALQINSLGYKPVVFNVNSMISTRYGVGAVVWAVYNATQTASLYVNSESASTITGCWQVQDYDANTNTIGYQLRTNSSTRPVSSATYRYRLMFSSLDNSKWVPATNSTSSNATSARTVNQEVINPWGRIVYYSTTTTRTAGQTMSATAQWDRYIFNLGYSFNDGSELDLTFPGPVYIKCTPQGTGGAIIDSTTPYVQTLPSTADGKIYIYLGQAYSESEVELIDYHPVLYHDGTKIAMWMGTSDFFDCVMTEENGEWSCDKNWLEIYNAYVNGKQIRLKYDGEIYMPIIIQGTIAYFGYTATVNEEGTIIVISNAFIFDLNGEVFSAGWSHHEYLSIPFSPSDKNKLDGIEAGAQVNVQSDWNQSDTSSDDYIKNRTHWKEVVTGADAGVVFEGDLPFIVYTGGGGGHIQTQVNDISIFFGYAARLTISHGGNNASIDMLAYSTEIGGKTVMGTSFDQSCSLSIQKNGGFEYIGVEVSSSVLETLGITSDTQVHIRIEWLPLLLNSASAEMFSMMGLSQFYYDEYHNYYEAPTGEFTNLIYQMATQELGGAFVGDYVKAGDILQLVINNGDPISVLMQPRDNGAACEAGNKNINSSYYEDTGENWYIMCVPGSFKVMIRGIEPQSVEVKFLSRQVVHKLSDEYTNIGKGQLIIQNEDLTPIAVFNPQQDYASIVPVQTPLPSKSGNAGKVLAVNNEGNGYEWIPLSGGGSLSNYDFTHTANTTVSGSTTTVTFAANQRGSAMLTISADLGLTIACNNGSDNYIWVKNIGSAEIDVTISAVTKNSTAVSYVYVPSDGITVPAGGVCEIGVIVNSDGAFITSRNDLAL